MYRLGIDIGGTKAIIGLLEPDGRLAVRKKERLPADKSWPFVLSWAAGEAAGLLEQAGIPKDRVQGCGIGIPGTVSADGQRVVKAPNLGWANVPAAAEFRRVSGIPARLVQDSRAAAYGEYRLGAGRGKQLVVCVTLGTGIGTGIVMDGRIFPGALGGAGELGHIPAVPGGRDCGCGQRGCLECYAAGKGLTATAKELLGQSATCELLFQQAEEGHLPSREAIFNAVTLLGNALVGAVNLLSPDCLLFSGGMSAQEELLVKPLTAYIRKRCYRAGAAAELSIRPAALGENAPMLGAALLPGLL